MSWWYEGQPGLCTRWSHRGRPLTPRAVTDGRCRGWSAEMDADKEETQGLLGDAEPREVPCCCVRWLKVCRRSKKTAVVVMFLAFMLDLMLLTVVEPLLPDILRSATLASGDYSTNSSLSGDHHGNQSRIPYLPAPGDDSVNPISLGIMNGAKPLTQVVINPVIGCLVDRWGHTVPMMVGFIVAFISTLGFAYSNNYALLMVTRCCQGLGSSLMTIAGLAMLSSVYRDPEERGKAMAIAFSGLAFGLVVGFPVGSFLYQFAGRPIPFISMAALILLGAIIRFCLMPVRLTTKEEREEERTGGACEGVSIFLDIYILVAGGVYFWLCYAIGTVMGIGPLFLQENLDAQQWQIGVIFLVGAIAQNISQYAMAVWSFRLGWWLTSMVGLITVAIGMGTYPLVTSLWVILAPQCVYGAGIGLVMGSVPPLLGHLADIRVNSQYGAVFALSDTGTNLGYFLGSTITGILTDTFSYFISFAVMAGVVALYSLFSPVLRNVPEKTKPISAEERQALLYRSWRRASRVSASFSFTQSQG